MFYLILLLFLSAVVSVITIYVIGEPGYIFLQWSTWQVETSVILAVAIVFLALIVIYLVFGLVSGIVRFPGRVGRSYREYKDIKRLIKTGQGVRLLLLGDWTKAEKLLNAMAEHLPDPVFNYLAAAYAAEARGDSAKRDEYLDKARGDGGDNRHLVDLVSCRFQIARGEFQESIEELKRICSHMPNHPVAFQLLAKAYEETGDWTALDQLRPHLEKSRAFTSDETRLLTSRIQIHRLQSAESASELLKVWKGLPSREQVLAENSACYARKLLEFDRNEEAEKVIRNSLGKNWNSELAYLYGLVGGAVSSRELYGNASKWLQDHPADPDLLLTAGKLAARVKFADEAIRHLRQAAENGGRAEASEVLANLLVEQDLKDEALEAYRLALSGTTR